MKIKLQKIVGNLLDKLQKLYMHWTVMSKCLAVLKLKKILVNVYFSQQIFYRKQSLGVLFMLRLNLLEMTWILKPCLRSMGDPTAKAWHSYLPNPPNVLSYSNVTFRMCIVTKSFFIFFPSVEVLGILVGYIIICTSSNSVHVCHCIISG